ncbi:hypothetical protein EVAR_40611_1 [Eumeta japonica]|uniref:Uncharacterized protein n=1 Tax=Eumeta variegata TaxID=151549 RepID=A0A4C1XGE0_EUMVA|nr:hypothetical protein EVAR_40611_1 [Eumeta japonica]
MNQKSAVESKLSTERSRKLKWQWASNIRHRTDTRWGGRVLERRPRIERRRTARPAARRANVLIDVTGNGWTVSGDQLERHISNSSEIQADDDDDTNKLLNKSCIIRNTFRKTYMSLHIECTVTVRFCLKKFTTT